MPSKNLVAFAGFAREGKDVAGSFLVDVGYQRVAFGDIIKRQLDPIIVQHLGFSAFTENNEQKAIIRGTLEQWGESNYQNIINEFFTRLPDRAVNTRIVRAREAKEWVRRGGVIYRIRRPNWMPATEWEEIRMNELKDAKVIAGEIANDGSLEQLRARVLEAAGVIS